MLFSEEVRAAMSALPMGSVLVGTKAFIAESLRWRRAFGGAMRQAGILAAACIYGLKHNVDMLTEGHANARRLAQGLANIGKIAIDPNEVETNIVVFDIAATGMTPAQFVQRLIKHGVRMSSYRGTAIRAVTHMDVGQSYVDQAVSVVARVLKGD